MIYVMARITVKPDAAVAAAAMLHTLVGETRREPGCISYDLFQRPDAPHVFQTVEQWSDQESLENHMKSPTIAAAMAQAAPILVAPPEILSFTKLM